MVELLHTQVLITSLIACFLAQGLKLVVEVVQHQRWNFHVLVETGGMPSSHSALVAALATGVGQSLGWGSHEFALSTIFAFIVMYDAAGIRRAAGEQAKILNQLVGERSLLSDLEPNPVLSSVTLKELLGHTPLQVFVGAALGVGISFLTYEFLPLG